MTITERLTRPACSRSSLSSRLCGSIPSRHTRATSAPKTVITAPPASAPSRCVRPVGLRPASVASLSRLPLVVFAIAPPLGEHVGLGQLAEEDPAEPPERPDLGGGARPVGPERRELLGEVAYADPQHAGRDELRRVVVGRLDV